MITQSEFEDFIWLIRKTSHGSFVDHLRWLYTLLFDHFLSDGPWYNVMVPDIIASHESNHSIFDLSPLVQWREDLKQDDTIQKQLCTFVNWGVFGTMKGGFDIFNCNRKPLAISFVSYMSLSFVSCMPLLFDLWICTTHLGQNDKWIQLSFIRRHLGNKLQSKTNNPITLLSSFFWTID